MDFERRPHQTVAPVRLVVTTTAYAIWITLVGDLDMANVGPFESTLGGLTLAEALPVHLDLSQLMFCDSRGLRSLLHFTATLRGSGHRVIARGARPMIQRLAVLMSEGETNLDGAVPQVQLQRHLDTGPGAT
ncbi:MAG: STAS domain-containing protein [Mycobacteriaceae bacterium]